MAQLPPPNKTTVIADGTDAVVWSDLPITSHWFTYQVGLRGQNEYEVSSSLGDIVLTIDGDIAIALESRPPNVYAPYVGQSNEFDVAINEWSMTFNPAGKYYVVVSAAGYDETLFVINAVEAE